LAIVEKELKDIKKRLDIEEEEDEQDSLFDEFKQKNLIKRKHAKEIKRLEALTTLNIHYQVKKTGVSDIIPAGSYVLLDYRAKPVCWCPQRQRSHSSCFEEVEDKYEEIPIPIIVTSAEHTTATGDGLNFYFANQYSEFIITAKDCKGQVRRTVVMILS